MINPISFYNPSHPVKPSPCGIFLWQFQFYWIASRRGRRVWLEDRSDVTNFSINIYPQRYYLHEPLNWKNYTCIFYLRLHKSVVSILINNNSAFLLNYHLSMVSLFCLSILQVSFFGSSLDNGAFGRLRARCFLQVKPRSEFKGRLQFHMHAVFLVTSRRVWPSSSNSLCADPT